MRKVRRFVSEAWPVASAPSIGTMAPATQRPSHSGLSKGNLEDVLARLVRLEKKLDWLIRGEKR